MRYSSVLTVTCPEVDRSTTQVEHAQNLPTNNFNRIQPSHVKQTIKTVYLLHIITLFHFALS